MCSSRTGLRSCRPSARAPCRRCPCRCEAALRYGVLAVLALSGQRSAHCVTTPAQGQRWLIHGHSLPLLVCTDSYRFACGLTSSSEATRWICVASSPPRRPQLPPNRTLIKVALLGDEGVGGFLLAPWGVLTKRNFLQGINLMERSRARRQTYVHIWIRRHSDSSLCCPCLQ